MKVIIAGGRDFQDYKLLSRKVRGILRQQKDVEIVSGGAMGADALGERFAKESGYELTVVKAEWYLHGKNAGPIRNKKMAEYADALILFWDGESKGSKSMLEESNRKGLSVRVVEYNNRKE